MEVKFFIQEGDVAKFQLQIEHADFSQATDNFYVVLRWGLFGKSLTIQKSEMSADEDDNFFLIFDSTGMVGQLIAECHYMVPDSDMSGGVREEVDRQVLGIVTTSGNPQTACSYTVNSDHVTYTRVWRGDTNTLYLNLRTSTQENITDSNGQQLRVRKQDSDLV